MKPRIESRQCFFKTMKLSHLSRPASIKDKYCRVFDITLVNGKMIVRVNGSPSRITAVNLTITQGLSWELGVS